MITIDEKWEAVLKRDRSFNGQFVYAIRTTGIYCRPDCAARKPKAENVLFFDLPQAAEIAGFRPCLRCLPQSTLTGNPQLEAIKIICHHLETVDKIPSLETLGKLIGWHPQYLQRTFKKIIGISPRQHGEACRLKKLQEKLRLGKDVTTAMYEVGYSSSSRLYEKSALGMTPAVYRRGGLGVKINYAIAPSRLGNLLVAATEKGICAVYLGNDSRKLLANLQQEFHQAELFSEEESLKQWVEIILAYLDNKASHLDLPLDIQASAFQWQVWETLKTIPYGETRSYSQVAETMGNPQAIRAVARACATNPVALIIPCHRVVAKNGDLAGYRWGVDKKKSLIELEAKYIEEKG